MERIKVIFLDIDGVLNYSKCKDRCGVYVGIDDANVALLKQIVDKTQAKIVLVSSWKAGWIKDKNKKKKQDNLANYLDDKMKTCNLEIHDKTKEFYLDRGKGIYDYIAKALEVDIKINRFVILDDEWFDYKKLGLDKYLVHTEYLDKGLTKEDVNKAIEILNSK